MPLNVRFRYERGGNLRAKKTKLRGALQKCRFFVCNCLIYEWNRVLVVYLDGWRIGQQDLHRSSRAFSITVSAKFHFDRYDILYTNLVQNNCVFEFSRASWRDPIGKYGDNFYKGKCQKLGIPDPFEPKSNNTKIN